MKLIMHPLLHRLSSAAAITLLLMPVAMAQSSAPSKPAPTTAPHDANGGHEEVRPHREPPPQAYEDCKGKKEGAIVQITTPREGKIAGTCTASPKGLFARPERPPQPQRGPEKPPEDEKAMKRK
jgi:hypothetical protein